MLTQYSRGPGVAMSATLSFFVALGVAGCGGSSGSSDNGKDKGSGQLGDDLGIPNIEDDEPDDGDKPDDGDEADEGRVMDSINPAGVYRGKVNAVSEDGVRSKPTRLFAMVDQDGRFVAFEIPSGEREAAGSEDEEDEQASLVAGQAVASRAAPPKPISRYVGNIEPKGLESEVALEGFARLYDDDGHQVDKADLFQASRISYPSADDPPSLDESDADEMNSRAVIVAPEDRSESDGELGGDEQQDEDEKEYETGWGVDPESTPKRLDMKVQSGGTTHVLTLKSDPEVYYRGSMMDSKISNETFEYEMKLNPGVTGWLSVSEQDDESFNGIEITHSDGCTMGGGLTGSQDGSEYNLYAITDLDAANCGAANGNEAGTWEYNGFMTYIEKMKLNDAPDGAGQRVDSVVMAIWHNSQDDDGSEGFIVRDYYPKSGG